MQHRSFQYTDLQSLEGLNDQLDEPQEDCLGGLTASLQGCCICRGIDGAGRSIAVDLQHKCPVIL